MGEHETYLREAVELARANIADGGTPYGALVVRDGEVLARAANQVHRTNDPTAHAESLALRETGRRLGRADLSGCVVYASGQPCPMCHAAMRLAGIREAYFAFTAEEGAAHGSGSVEIYAELCQPLEVQPMRVRYLPLDGEPSPYAFWAEQRSA